MQYFTVIIRLLNEVLDPLKSFKRGEKSKDLETLELSGISTDV